MKQTTFNRYSVGTGHFNLANPVDVDTEVWFNLREDAPFDRRRLQFTFNVDNAAPEDFDSLSVLEAARLCKTAIDRYILHHEKGEIAALVAYLETVDIQDQLESKQAELEELTDRIQELTQDIESLKESLNER